MHQRSLPTISISLGGIIVTEIGVGWIRLEMSLSEPRHRLGACDEGTGVEEGEACQDIDGPRRYRRDREPPTAGMHLKQLPRH